MWRSPRGNRLRTTLLVAVAAVAAALGLLAYGTGLFKRTELDSIDARFSIRGERPPPRDIVLVEVDDVTFDELGLQWPFPRSLHGAVVRRLTEDGARGIAYDVQFTEPTKASEDNALVKAVDDAERVVLSTTEVDDRGQSRVFGGESVLRQIGARAAHTGIVPDSDGIYRRFPFEVDGLESFAVATAEANSGRQVPPSGFGGESAWIDYHGPPGTFPSASFSTVARGKAPPGFFRDKVVVIGASAPSLQDVHATPTSGDEVMSGPEIQANALSTVRRGLPLDDAPGMLNLGLIVLLGVAVPVAGLYLAPGRSLLLALTLGLVFLVGVQLAFSAGLVVALTYPLLALALASVGALGVHYMTAALERQRTRDIFARFVPESVVNDVLGRTDEDLRLGGVRRDGTVMFTDLRGFTSFAESLDPTLVIQVLNRYLSEMSEAIMNHGGTLVAYMGDGIMAVFGAPIEQEDHADRALAAAREMLGERLGRVNDWLCAEGLCDGFKMGIGLNSGSVMSGNVGSKRRLEYTAIGDTTNTAARLEGMTKGTGHQLFISESTRSRLKRDVPELVCLGELEVRGRAAAITVWSVPESRSLAAPEEVARAFTEQTEPAMAARASR